LFYLAVFTMNGASSDPSDRASADVEGNAHDCPIKDAFTRGKVNHYF